MGFYEVMVLVLLFAIFVTLLSVISVLPKSGYLPVKVKTDEDEFVEVVKDVGDENFTSKEYEKVRLKREEEFDNRIRSIKAELEQSMNTPLQVKRTGNIPDISDGIYNLPHGDVKDGYDNDGYEEVSE